MEKFSKLDKKKPKVTDKVLYETDYLTIKSRNNWVYVEEPDNVCILPYIIENEELLIRMEVIPSFQSRDNEEYHITCISGTIEKDDSPEKCVVRELEEEAGIRLKQGIEIEFFDILYKSKSQSSKFYLCILPLHVWDFENVLAKGDGSKIEELSKTVKVSVENIDKVFASDIVTKLLIEKFKNENEI